MDIADDRDIAVIFVASDGVQPGGKTAFEDLRSDLSDEQVKRQRRRLLKRWPELFGVLTVAESRQMLEELVDQQIVSCPRFLGIVA